MFSNFPALDSLTTEGIIQSTVSERHPINQTEIIQAVELYDRKPVNYYFFVPSHIFAEFKMQQIKPPLPGKTQSPIRQYAVSVDVNVDSFPGDAELKRKRRRLSL